MTADANVAYLTVTYKLEIYLTSSTDLLWHLMTNALLSCEHQGRGNVIDVTVCSIVLQTIANSISCCKCCGISSPPPATMVQILPFGFKMDNLSDAPADSRWTS